MNDGLFKRSNRGFGMNAKLPTRPEGSMNKPAASSVQTPKSLEDLTEYDMMQLSDKELMQFFVRNNLLTQMYASATMVGHTRQEMYRDYETMMDNVLMTSYLDLLVDDALQFDADRDATVWVGGSTPYAEDIEEFLYDILDIENTGPGIMYILAQYGDYFLMPIYELGKGIVSVRSDIFPGNVWRIDLQGELFAFAYQDSSQVYGTSYSEAVGSTRIVSSRGFVHFMLNYKPNFYKSTLAIPKDAIKDLYPIAKLPESDLSFVTKSADGKEITPLSENRVKEIRGKLKEFVAEVDKVREKKAQKLQELELKYSKSQITLMENVQIPKERLQKIQEQAERVYLIEKEAVEQDFASIELDLSQGMYNILEDQEFFHFHISSKYGSSMLFPARKDVKILNLVEQALALSRLARSGVARIYYVNTEGATPEERRDIMTYMEEKFTQQQTFDMNNQLWKSDYYPFNYLDDIFLPVTGGKGDTKIDQIGGDVDVKAIVDIEWFLSKVFAGLQVPKAYLGFEEAMPGALGSTTLLRLDIRYARKIKKLQRAFKNGIELLAKYHLEAKYQKEIPLDQVPIAMTTISGAEEADRWNALKDKLEIVSSIMSFVKENEGDVQLMARTLYDNFLDINYENVTSKNLFPDKEEKKEQPPEDGSNGGMETDFSPEESMPMRSDVEDLGDVVVPETAEAELPEAEEV